MNCLLGILLKEADSIREVRVWQNPLDLLTWIAQYQLVVATRFHALVMAGTGKIPFIGWGDQKKACSLLSCE